MILIAAGGVVFKASMEVKVTSNLVALNRWCHREPCLLLGFGTDELER
jgi:hypothetical protein